MARSVNSRKGGRKRTQRGGLGKDKRLARGQHLVAKDEHVRARWDEVIHLPMAAAMFDETMLRVNARCLMVRNAVRSPFNWSLGMNQ